MPSSKKAKDEYKKEMADNGPPDNTEDSDSSTGGSYLEINYKVFLANRDIISVQFNTDSYSAGAAHPNGGVFVFNYSPRNKREVKFAELFLPNAPYKAKIDTNLKKIVTNYDVFSDDSGGVPEDRWNVTRKGLLISLDVPHALGDTVDAFIPYKELQDVIKADGPLADVMAQVK